MVCGAKSGNSKRIRPLELIKLLSPLSQKAFVILRLRPIITSRKSIIVFKSRSYAYS